MLKTVLKNTTENGMIKENSQIKEKILISSEKNLTKKQEDLGLLIELRKNIKDFKQENMKSSLGFIGKKLHSINWDKNDLSCVRNKHGYRNRHVNKGNQVNLEGAMLNFEVLSHLEQVVNDNSMVELLNKNFAEVERSIKIIETKIDFILFSEVNFLSPQQNLENIEIQNNNFTSSHLENSDIGFLLRLAAYFHDLQCIKKMLGLVEELKNVQLSYFNKRISRYHLSYIFCQLGKTAKELSDFLKEESCSKAELNFLRYMFGKLGQYRQNIKENIYIVRNLDDKRFFQMWVMFEKAMPFFTKLLIDLENLLKKSSNKISTYKVIYREKNNNEDRMEMVLEKECKDESMSTIDYLTVCFADGTENFKKRKLSLEKQIQDIEVKITERKEELEALKKKPYSFKDENEYIAKELFDNKGFKEISYLINLPQLQSKLSMTISNLETLTPLCDTAKTTELEAYGLLIRIKNNLKFQVKEKIRKYINMELSDLKSMTLNGLGKIILKIKEENGILDASGKSFKETEEKIKKLKILNDEKIKELEKVNQRIIEIDEKNEELKKTVAREQESSFEKRNETKHASAIAIVYEEIEFIKKISVEKSDFLINAVKMSLGIIGQCCIKVKEEAAQNYILSRRIHILLQVCIEKTIYLRSKFILHDMANSDDEKINETFFNFILPSSKDFWALEVVTNDPEDQEKDILAKALLRLGAYREASEILREYLDLIDKGRIKVSIDYELIANNSPELKPIIQLKKIIAPYFGLENQLSIEQLAFEYNQKLSTLLLLLDSYILGGDSKNALETAEKSTILIESLTLKLKQFLFASFQQEILEDLFKIKLYCELQKSYLLLVRGDSVKSDDLLKKIKGMLEGLGENKKRYGSVLARIYTDLIYSEYNRIEITNKYFLELSLLIEFCEDGFLVEFNTYFRRYELALGVLIKDNKLSDFERKQKMFETFSDLKAFFLKSEKEFKEKLGLQYFRYKMEVLLAEYNFHCAKCDLNQAGKTLQELDCLSAQVNDVVTINKYFISKLNHLILKNDSKLYENYFEKYFEHNYQSGTEHKFKDGALSIISNSLKENPVLFRFSVKFLKEKITNLTSAENEMLDKLLSEMQASLKPLIFSSVSVSKEIELAPGEEKMLEKLLAKYRYYLNLKKNRMSYSEKMQFKFKGFENVDERNQFLLFLNQFGIPIKEITVDESNNEISLTLGKESILKIKKSNEEREERLKNENGVKSKPSAALLTK